jgi:hypothetical protein
MKDNHTKQMSSMSGSGGDAALVKQLREEIKEQEESISFNMEMFNM